MIRCRKLPSGKFECKLLSEDGKKNLGTFRGNTRQAARKRAESREREVQFFKRRS